MNTLNLLISSSSSSSSSATSLHSCFPKNGLLHLHHQLGTNVGLQTTKPIFLSPRQWRRHIIKNPRNSNPNSSNISSFFRRTKNPKKYAKPTSDQRIEMFVIDIEDIAYRARSSVRRFFNSTETKLNRFVSSGTEALEDLKTIVTIDNDRRVIIAYRRSTLQFFGNLVLWGLVVFVAVRVFMELEFLGFRGGYGRSFVWKRDRSLAGKEVVVGKRRFKERVPINPLTPVRDTVNGKIAETGISQRKRGASEERLPKWWPVSVPSSPASNSVMNFAEPQKEAERVMRAIMDNRMSGQDITEDDIIQFRQICKRSGARVLLQTANARDSFYRSSVDLVVNACSRSINHSTHFQIDGEDAQHFVAGIALNLGLDSIRAARIVSAAVAARTRSWFLQAWALEMQGKRMQALEELSKICRVHQIFPPEESSPEMEMVGRGLEKHLKREQREYLFDMLVEICGAGSRRSAAEALGLAMHQTTGLGSLPWKTPKIVELASTKHNPDVNCLSCDYSIFICRCDLSEKCSSDLGFVQIDSPKYSDYRQ